MVDEDSEAEREPAKKRPPARKRPPAKTTPKPIRRTETQEDEESEEDEQEPTGAKKRRRQFSSGFATLRDLISFIAGLVIIYHEVFQSKKVDTAAVGVGVALLGLPAVLNADERRGKA